MNIIYDGKRRKAAGASAVRYDGLSGGGPAMTEPTFGRIAQRIAERAREHGVVLHEDPALVETLVRLEIGATIPRELYAVIAEVLAFIYAVDAAAAPGPAA